MYFVSENNDSNPHNHTTTHCFGAYEKKPWQCTGAEIPKIIVVLKHVATYSIQIWPSCCFYVPSAALHTERKGSKKARFELD